MIGLLALMAASQAAGPQTELTVPAEFHAATAEVRLGDLADLAALPENLRRTAGPLTVAVASQPTVTITRKALFGGLRRQAPALGPWLPHDENGVLRIHFAAAAAAASPASPPPRCAALTGEVAADAYLQPGDLVPHACAEEPKSAAYYDRTGGFVRARRALKTGEIIAAPPSSALAAIPPGQTLVLATKVGPVIVERTVRAVRPAHAGAPVFVAPPSGPVFVAPAPEGAH